jgi:hypothetical protein
LTWKYTVNQIFTHPSFSGLQIIAKINGCEIQNSIEITVAQFAKC